MRCPYGYDVGIPPRRHLCVQNPGCWCDGDLEAINAGALDRQSIHVQQWWEDVHRKGELDRVARHLHDRPTIEIEEHDG